MAPDARPSPGSRAGAPWTRVTAYWWATCRRTWRGSVFSDFAAPVPGQVGVLAAYLVLGVVLARRGLRARTVR